MIEGVLNTQTKQLKKTIKRKHYQTCEALKNMVLVIWKVQTWVIFTNTHTARIVSFSGEQTNKEPENISFIKIPLMFCMFQVKWLKYAFGLLFQNRLKKIRFFFISTSFANEGIVLSYLYIIYSTSPGLIRHADHLNIFTSSTQWHTYPCLAHIY